MATPLPAAVGIGVAESGAAGATDPGPMAAAHSARAGDSAVVRTETADTPAGVVEAGDGDDLVTNWLASGTARRAATDAERRALASVLRLRILRMCLYEPLTNREIAERVGLNPATVLHHVRTLADQGFLVAGDPRRGRRGSREIPYRATGKSWRLDLSDGDTSKNILLQTFLAEVALVPAGDVDASRLGLRLSPEHEQELRSRLASVLDEFASRPQDPDGKRLSLFLAIHPEP